MFWQGWKVGNIVGKGENVVTAFLPFATMFSTLPKTTFNISHFILLSANSFNLDQSKILLFCKGVLCIHNSEKHSKPTLCWQTMTHYFSQKGWPKCCNHKAFFARLSQIWLLLKNVESGSAILGSIMLLSVNFPWENWLANCHFMWIFIWSGSTLTLSQTSPGFYVSAVQVFWKHCGKRRNCSFRAISPFPAAFSTCLQNFLPSSSSSKLSSANSFSFEESKICRLGKA